MCQAFREDVPGEYQGWVVWDILVRYLADIMEPAMQVQLACWGNSLGLRIPKELAERLGLREGARVEVEAEGDRLVIKTDRPYYRLEELLTGISPEDMCEAFDWGPDVGREVVD